MTQASSLYIRPGLLLVIGGALDADEHVHHAIQVVWPVDWCELEVGGEIHCGAAVIAADTPHRLVMDHGLVLLVEPQSRWGASLDVFLAGRKSAQIGGLPDLSQLLTETADPHPVLMSLARAFGWESWPSVGDGGDLPRDDRIASLLVRLDACFDDRCLKPDHWRAVEVAASLSLSEGRFLHLFRDQMGIAWRRYLLWRRLLCSANAMKGGRSATDAAHEAGFSDSAHLSRTFRKSFGLSIRQAMTLFR